jgi:hypothetical protein
VNLDGSTPLWREIMEREEQLAQNEGKLALLAIGRAEHLSGTWASAAAHHARIALAIQDALADGRKEGYLQDFREAAGLIDSEIEHGEEEL